MPEFRPADPSPPPVSNWLQNGFHTFLRPYLKRHFHCVGLHRGGGDPRSVGPGQPLIVYSNHPSWWDPLIGHYLNATLFPGRQFHAPIDAEALRQYQVFGKLGFYGIDLGSTSGAAAFLKTSRAILDTGTTALWITPEGRFCDVRDHSSPLMPGLAHLCGKLQTGYVFPLALEYAFWEERLPLCLLRFGEPFQPAEQPGWDKPRWAEELMDRLRMTQRTLADLVIARDPSLVEPLLIGRVGSGAIYDTMRRFKSWLTRSTFRPGHGKHFQ